MNKELALRTLLDAKRILDRLGVPFFLVYGTCLGAVRDKDFIENDGDIDIGILGDERLDEIRNAFLEDGFTLTTVGKTVFRYLPARKYDIPIDVYVYKETEENWQCWVKGGKPWLYFPKRFGKMETIEFLGVEFNIPSPVQEFLEWVYGDWKVKSNVTANQNWQTK